MVTIDVDKADKLESHAAILETINISKRFGDVKALQNVSLKLKPGSFHALLGENGAGKSTLVKCIMGYYQHDDGQMLYNGREVIIKNPQHAAQLGIGMVYQHFTLVPNMTVAENIVLAQPVLPLIINWKAEIARLENEMASMPFSINLNKKISELSAGEKQKIEITKQLFLKPKILILDEPTSVLTPIEADEVLGKIHQLTKTKGITVLIITHKFREVTQFADHITILRKGQFIASMPVADTSEQQMAELMVGSEINIPSSKRVYFDNAATKLELKNINVLNDNALPAIKSASLVIKGGEIVGIAGVSGNGQRELVEALAGQRDIHSGTIFAQGKLYHATRKDMRDAQFYCLPEEPLRNASVANLSIAENLALRKFDEPSFTYLKFFLNHRAVIKNATQLIAQYAIRTSGPRQMIGALSGGNVQRTVLAREINQNISIFVIANPCFGLDFKAVSTIRQQILAARNKGCAILLVSEDLDEILELSDRILVISSGEFVYETTPDRADLSTIGQYMAGH
jgi:simple sugar transport system ATP-binding protein